MCVIGYGPLEQKQRLLKRIEAKHHRLLCGVAGVCQGTVVKRYLDEMEDK